MDTINVCPSTLEAGWNSYKLSNRIVDRELDRFCDNYPELETLIQNSFLSEELKAIYLSSFKYRQSTLKN